MIPLLAGSVWLGLSAALVITLLNQLRKYEVLRALADADPAAYPPLTIIIPARNEAAAIRRCLSGLLQQTYPADRLEVIVVDDNSTDGTGEIVRRLAETHPFLKVIEARPLPPGWLGKSHACYQAAAVARGEWLCFVDADTDSDPALALSAVAYSESARLDMLSLQPFQELVTFWERLVMPARLILAALVVDLARVRDSRAPSAAANGQFILIRRAVYDAIGGHAAVAMEFLEDVALARLLKRAGYRIAMIGGRDLIRTRMYTDFWSVWRGQTKNAVGIFHNLSQAALVALLVILLVWLPVIIPLAIASAAFPLSENGTPGVWGFGLALTGSALVIGVHLVTITRFFHVPIIYGLLMPLAFTMIGVITLNGVFQRVAGRIQWKERAYPAG